MKFKQLINNLTANYKARKLFDWYELNETTTTKYKKYRDCGKFEDVFDNWINVSRKYRDLGFELSKTKFEINIYHDRYPVYTVDDRLDRSVYFLLGVNDHEKQIVKDFINELYSVMLELKSLINDLEVNM